MAPKSDSVLATTNSQLATPKAKRIKNSAPVVAPPSSSIKVTTTNFGSRLAEQKKLEAPIKTKGQKPKAEKVPRIKQKNDPAKVKAARYVRDRYMEEINRGDYLVSNGKYDVTRLIENAPVPVKGITGGVPTVPPDQKLLAA